MRRTPRLRPALAALLGAVLLGTAACGGGWPAYDAPLTGSVQVDNLSSEYALGFYLAPSGTDAFTDNLLYDALPPGATDYVGDVQEDWYDAEADLEYGDLVQWFDVDVPADQVTTFEIW
jgi:hypothetical protein